MIVETEIFKPLESLHVHIHQGPQSNPDAQENEAGEVDGDICARAPDVLFRFVREKFV
jgi:hypothetical protein